MIYAFQCKREPDPIYGIRLSFYDSSSGIKYYRLNDSIRAVEMNAIYNTAKSQAEKNMVYFNPNSNYTAAQLYYNNEVDTLYFYYRTENLKFNYYTYFIPIVIDSIAHSTHFLSPQNTGLKKRAIGKQTPDYIFYVH